MIPAGMALFNMADLLAQLGRDQRLIGLDPGSKTIGVALSDVGRMIATPYGSLKRGKLMAMAVDIGAIARKQDAGGLVVGWPLSMDGSVGPAAQAARDWTLALSDATGLPAALWDERLSSSAVNRFLIDELDLSRGKRAKDRGRNGGRLYAAGRTRYGPPMSGLLALLDDVAALAKVAAASLDDVAAQAVRSGAKAAGVVIDDAAVTPAYVSGVAAERELSIVGRIALGVAAKQAGVLAADRAGLGSVRALGDHAAADAGWGLSRLRGGREGAACDPTGEARITAVPSR